MLLKTQQNVKFAISPIKVLKNIMKFKILAKNASTIVALLIAGSPHVQLRAVTSTPQSTIPSLHDSPYKTWNWNGLRPNKPIEVESFEQFFPVVQHTESFFIQSKKLLKLSYVEWTRIRQQLGNNDLQYRFISDYQWKKAAERDPELANVKQSIVKCFDKMTLNDGFVYFVFQKTDAMLSPTVMTMIQQRLFKAHPAIMRLLSVIDQISSLQPSHYQWPETNHLWKDLHEAVDAMKADDWSTFIQIRTPWSSFINWSSGLRKLCLSQIQADSGKRAQLQIMEVARHLLHVDYCLDQSMKYKPQQVTSIENTQYTKELEQIQKDHASVYWPVIEQCLAARVQSQGLKDHFHHYLLKSSQYADTFEKARLWGQYAFYFFHHKGAKCRRDHHLSEEACLRNIVDSFVPTLNLMSSDDWQLMALEIDNPVWRAFVPWVPMLLEKINHRLQSI